MYFKLKIVRKEALLARFEVLSKNLLIRNEKNLKQKPAVRRYGLQGRPLNSETPRIWKISANDLSLTIAKIKVSLNPNSLCKSLSLQHLLRQSLT
jgi:hypothetical protein